MKVFSMHSPESTAVIAEHIFSTLEIKDFEKRESSNYPPESSYYKGLHSSGAVIKIYASDSENKDEYNIQIAGEESAVISVCKDLTDSDLQLTEE
jgi:hypothetical protein